MEEFVKYLRAMLMLQVQDAQAAARAQNVPLKLEMLLADAGFSHREVSVILAKSPAAVAKAISRGRAARKENAVEELGGHEGDAGE
jgi:hypothetical protein